MPSTRIQKETRAGRAVWVKSHGRSDARWRLSLLRLFARATGIAALLPPPAQEAAEAGRTEQEMIERLAALGVRVPEIIEAGEQGLVLSDLGPTLASRCRNADSPEEREALVESGMAAISDLHARGGHASQAFARNLTVDAQGVGFIDLEEDPSRVMPLPAAQARDWLFFVHSTARYLREEPQRYLSLLVPRLRAEPQAVRVEIMRAARAMSWLAMFAMPFGHRAHQAAVAVQILARLQLHL